MPYPVRAFHFMRATLLALAFLLFAWPVAAQSPPPNAAAAPQPDAAAQRSIAGLEALLKQRPDDATLWFFLSRAQVQAGQLAAAIASMENVAKLGEGFLPTREDFGPVWDHARFRELRDQMAEKLPRLDVAATAFTLEDRTILPEGIAYDAPSRSFFVGSVLQHKVMRVHEDGAIENFVGLSGDLDSVLGIAADAPRRMLYVVSTNGMTDVADAKRRNAIVAYDIDSRRLLQRYDVAGARQLNDVAVAPGGRVFATDSASGAVYEIAVKGPGPTREVVPAGALRGSNGLAASADGKRLYVAHATGIAVLDLASGELKRVDNRTRETVGAIDGLYQWHGELIGVQNVTTPGRVIRITLSPAGDSITAVHTLLSHHHPLLDEPTTAAPTDHGLFLLAATGVSHYNRKGLVDHPETVPKPTVLRVPF